MSEPILSVIMLSYHPKKEALFSTLKSIVLQKDCDYELIVADDGSANFFEGEIRTFLDTHGVCNYQILAHPQNQGTVKNLLDAVKLAKGRYVKPISPGDYLYDAHTLRDVAAFMHTYDAQAAFGEMVFYSYGDSLQVKNLTHPYIDRLYCADMEGYSFRKAQKHQLILGDFICGAAAVYETRSFAQALETLSAAVVYAEDASFQLFAMQNIRIYKIPRKVVWYEHGDGISTKGDSCSFTRIDTDFYNFYYEMARRYPKNRYIKRTCRIWEIRKNGTRWEKILHRWTAIDKICFSLYNRWHRKRLRAPQYNDTFFRLCHIPGEETAQT